MDDSAAFAVSPLFSGTGVSPGLAFLNDTSSPDQFNASLTPGISADINGILSSGINLQEARSPHIQAESYVRGYQNSSRASTLTRLLICLNRYEVLCWCSYCPW